MVSLGRTLVLAALAVVSGCGAAPAAGPAARVPEATDSASERAPVAAASGGRQVSATRGGTSCEAARAAWADDAAARGADAPKPPPEHDEELKNTLNRGSYLNDCGVPESADVSICAAIVDGKARGVSIAVEGGTQAQADCLADLVGKMPFPSHETMSITKTRFAPTK